MTTVVGRGRIGHAAARLLGRSAANTVAAVLAADPVATCMVASRFEIAGMNAARLGGVFLGVGGGRRALCFAGGNVIPLHLEPGTAAPVAAGLLRHGRRGSSLVGPAAQVLDLWAALAPAWGAAREVRADQPLLTCPGRPAVAPDRRVRAVPGHLFERYFPAAVAMFTEEVGVDPTAGDGGAGYRRAVGELVDTGRAFAIFDGETVVYKAEIGSFSRSVALVQGVWVHPAWRGRGIAAPATAAVVAEIQRRGLLPSLYVNAHNAPARAAYARLGFGQVGTFASVLL